MGRVGKPPRQAATSLRLEVARTLAELDALADRWRALEPEMPLATLQHAWISGAVEAFGHERDPHVLLAYRGDELCGIAPLWQAAPPDNRLSLIGANELGEPMDLVAGDDEVRALHVRAMLDARVPLSLQRLHWDGRTAAAVRRAAGARTLVVTRAGTSLPWMDLGPQWCEPETQMTPRRRGDLRRAERRARQLGATHFEVLAPGPADVDPVVQEAFEVESRGWKGRAGTALLCDRRRGAFYRAFARRAAREEQLRVSFLRVDGRPAAMQIGTEFGGRYWTYKIGYDEHFRRVSPGVQLMTYMIGWAARRGLEGCELLGEGEDWLRVWTTDEHPSQTLHCYPSTARGLRSLAADAAAFGSRRLARSGRVSPQLASTLAFFASGEAPT